MVDARTNLRYSEAQSPFAMIADAVQARSRRPLSPQVHDSFGPPELKRLRDVIVEEISRYNQEAVAHGYAPVKGPPDMALERVLYELMGLGPLEALLAHQGVEDLYILGPSRIVAYMADGSRQKIPINFGGQEGLMSLVHRALALDGKRLDPGCPFADARLPDGSRIHVGSYPCVDPWPQVVIRKHRRLFEQDEDRLARLIALGTISPLAALLLRFAIRSRVSMLVTGATASGKTTLINALGSEIDSLTSVVCIEDSRELEFTGKNVSYLITRPPAPDGSGEITQRFLVQQSLRKRAEWIVLGEARGAEAWDFVQAGNTGHAIMGSVHANDPRNAVERYRDLCLESGENLLETIALKAVVRAFRLVVYVEIDPQRQIRLVRHISEVTGNITEKGIPVLQELFTWDRGALRCTGSRPYPALARLMERCGYSYDHVLRGEGVPDSWKHAVQGV